MRVVPEGVETAGQLAPADRARLRLRAGLPPLAPAARGRARGAAAVSAREPRRSRSRRCSAALSYALDITEGEPPGHAVRTLAIGMRIAEQLRLGDDVRSALFYALLLKDAGCSANASRLSSLFAADDQPAKAAMKRVDWSRSGSAGALHVALDRAGRLAAGQGAPDARDHPGGRGHARDDRHPLRARRRDRPHARAARADRRTRSARSTSTGTAAATRAACAARRSRCSAASSASRRASRCSCARWARAAPTGWRSSGAAAGSTRRWSTRCSASATTPRSGARCEDPRAVPPVAGWEPRDRVLHADDDQLDRVAEAFARVIDAKSPYTASHSAGRGDLRAGDRRRDGDGRARSSATCAAPGCCTTSASSRSPRRILDKPGRLTEEEFAAMREHTRYTLQILERVRCFRHLAGIAASHHERLDGSGYHRGLAAFDLPRPARILAVADVFDALTADRPYRAAMPLDAGAGDRARAGRQRALPGGRRGPGGRARRRAGVRRPRSATTLGGHEGLRPPVRRPA